MRHGFTKLTLPVIVVISLFFGQTAALTGTMEMIGADYFDEGKHYAFCGVRMEGGQLVAFDNIGRNYCRSDMSIEFEARITPADQVRKSSMAFVREPFNLPHATLTKLLKVNGESINSADVASAIESEDAQLKRQMEAMVAISDKHRRLAASSGRSDLLVVRVKLQDDSTVDTYCSEACALEYGWGTNSARVGYAQSSYGALDVSAATGVVKTVALSTSVATYVGCNFDLLGNDAVAALTASGFSTTGYEVIQFYMPTSIPNCGFGGVAYVGGSRSWVRQSGVGTMVHELGHSYGVWHSGTDLNNDGVQDTEYGDYSCMMGSPSGLVTMHGIHRMALGWIPTNAIKTISCPTGCTQSHTIGDLQQAPATTVANGQFTMLKTKRVSRAGDYYISYRAGTGVDANLGSTYKNKVSLHYYNGGNSELVTTLSAGQTYIDTLTINGNSAEMLRVSVSSISSGVAVVSVTITAPSSFCTDVTVSMTDSYGDGWNGNSLFFTADKSVSVSLASGSSGSDSVCLPPGTYTPFACGGTWQQEVGWTIVGYGLSGGATTTCTATSGSFTIAANAPTLAPVFKPTTSPTNAPVAVPTSAPVFAPTRAPTMKPTTATPTPAPTPVPSVSMSPTFSPTESPTNAPTPEVCYAQSSKLGDGLCDNNNVNNVGACFWDGGDCCRETCLANSNNKIRKNCGKRGYNCLDPALNTYAPTSAPTKQPTPVPTPSPTEPVPTVAPTPNPSAAPTPIPPTPAPVLSTAPTPAPEVCSAQTKKLGDGLCDNNSINNIAACFWDGGDCCRASCLANSNNKIRKNCGKRGYNCLDPSSS
jgi:hypothetical protein